jgi:GT2 family glycosyltransferase
MTSGYTVFENLSSNGRRKVTAEITRDPVTGNILRPLCVSVITIVKRKDDAVFLSSLEKQACEDPFEVIVVKGGNRAQARNYGVTQSRAPLVAFIDSDCEAPRSWLASLLAALPENQNVAGVGGISMGRNSESNLEKSIDGVFSTYLGSLDSPSLISVPETKRHCVKSISGHNCIYRKSALLEVGGYDERYEIAEDTDISARLREEGYTILLDRSLFVYHRRRDSMFTFAKRFFWYGVGRLRSIHTSWRNTDGRIMGLFLLALVIALAAPKFPLVFKGALLSYVLLILVSSIIGALKNGSIKLSPLMALLFLIEHLSYLMGLIMGLFVGPWQAPETNSPIILERYVFPSGICASLTTPPSRGDAQHEG